MLKCPKASFWGNLGGIDAVGLTETLDEIADGGEAGEGGDGLDGQCAVCAQQFLGSLHPDGADELKGLLAGGGGEHAVECGAAHAEVGGELRDIIVGVAEVGFHQRNGTVDELPVLGVVGNLAGYGLYPHIAVKQQLLYTPLQLGNLPLRVPIPDVRTVNGYHGAYKKEGVNEVCPPCLPPCRQPRDGDGGGVFSPVIDVAGSHVHGVGAFAEGCQLDGVCPRGEFYPLSAVDAV